MDNLELKFENLNFSSMDAIGESLPDSSRGKDTTTSTRTTDASRSRKLTKPYYTRPTGTLIHRAVRPLSEQDSEDHTPLALGMSDDETKKSKFNSSIFYKDEETSSNVEHELNDREAEPYADEKSDFIRKLSNDFPEHKRSILELEGTSEYLNWKSCRGETLLHLAVRSNNEELIKVLLKKGIQADVKDEHGDTPLHFSVKIKCITSINALLTEEALRQVDAKNADGDTPLHLAAQMDNIEMINALLGVRGINVDAKDKHGRIPLHYAAMNGSTGSLKVLLPISQVNARDYCDNTPLHLAARMGHKECLKTLLLRTEIEINPRNNSHNTPLHLAVVMEKIEIIKELLITKGIKLNVKNNYDNTLLHLAITTGNIEIVQALLEEDDIPIDVKNEAEKTPFRLAFEIGNINVLLAIGAIAHQVNARDEYGDTPLHWATQRNSIELVNALLSIRGIHVDVQNNCGDTPLHLVIRRRGSECFKALLNATDIKKTNNEGDTLLHLAVSGNHAEFTEELLAVGIEVDVRNNAGDTPLHLAIKRGNIVLVDALLHRKAIQQARMVDKNGNTALHLAATEGSVEVVKALLNVEGLSINAQNNKGWTPLRFAVENVSTTGPLKVLLLVEGIDLNVQDSDGETPLYSAITPFSNIKECDKYFNMLLEAGARIDIKNNRGNTLLHAVVNALNNKTCFKALLTTKNIKIIVNMGNCNGDTPLHCAVINRSTEFVKALLTVGGIDLDVRNNAGYTPFQLALKIDSPRIICAFLSLGTFVQIRDRERGDPIPLDYAVRAYSMEKIDALANAMCSDEGV